MDTISKLIFVFLYFKKLLIFLVLEGPLQRLVVQNLCMSLFKTQEKAGMKQT